MRTHERHEGPRGRGRCLERCARGQPRGTPHSPGRVDPAHLHRPAVQHGQAPTAPVPPDHARSRWHRGLASRFQRTQLHEHQGRPLRLRRRVRGLLGVPRTEAHRGTSRARPVGNALPPPRLSRGALCEGSPRCALWPRVVSQRDHLGVRLRSAYEEAMAREARHDPRVRQGPKKLFLQLGGRRSRALHGARPRHERKS